MLVSFFHMIIISTSPTVQSLPSPRFHVEPWLPFRTVKWSYCMATTSGITDIRYNVKADRIHVVQKQYFYYSYGATDNLFIYLFYDFSFFLWTKMPKNDKEQNANFLSKIHKKRGVSYQSTSTILHYTIL